MRRTLFALVAVLALAGAACSSDSSTPSDGSTGGGSCADPTPSDSVTIADFAFDPNCFTTSAGTTISLSNDDDTTHSFTLDDSAADVSVDVDAGSSGEATAPDAGTYTFHCRFHSQMTGTLIVS